MDSSWYLSTYFSYYERQFLHANIKCCTLRVVQRHETILLIYHTIEKKMHFISNTDKIPSTYTLIGTVALRTSLTTAVITTINHMKSQTAHLCRRRTAAILQLQHPNVAIDGNGKMYHISRIDLRRRTCCTRNGGYTERDNPRKQHGDRFSRDQGLQRSNVVLTM